MFLNDDAKKFAEDLIRWQYQWVHFTCEKRDIINEGMDLI